MHVMNYNNQNCGPLGGGGVGWLAFEIWRTVKRVIG